MFSGESKGNIGKKSVKPVVKKGQLSRMKEF